ncbi:MAG: hypothetical protein IPJ06_19555 [Saprospiraceae bacterium]|nr:hypothetical protein [Saprospiraceae bacterium]
MSHHGCFALHPDRIGYCCLSAARGHSHLFHFPDPRSCDPSPPSGWTDGNGNNTDRCYNTGFTCSEVTGWAAWIRMVKYYLVAFSDGPDQLTFP